MGEGGIRSKSRVGQRKGTERRGGREGGRKEGRKGSAGGGGMEGGNRNTYKLGTFSVEAFVPDEYLLYYCIELLGNFQCGEEGRKHWALRPQKPLRLIRDGEVGGGGA